MYLLSISNLRFQNSSQLATFDCLMAVITKSTGRVSAIPSYGRAHLSDPCYDYIVPQALLSMALYHAIIKELIKQVFFPHTVISLQFQIFCANLVIIALPFLS